MLSVKGGQNAEKEASSTCIFMLFYIFSLTQKLQLLYNLFIEQLLPSTEKECRIHHRSFHYTYLTFLPMLTS